MATAITSELLTREEAASFLKLNRQTLAIWANTGSSGPPYIRVGRRIRYRKSDLESWLDRNTVNAEAPAAE